MTHVLERPQLRTGVGHHLIERHPLIHEPVDERCVGAVFEQAPDEIGKQVCVRADRRIDPHSGEIGPLSTCLVVQQGAHAMQALEFEAPGVGFQREDRADRVRVVRGELRVHQWGRAEQSLCTGEVGHIGGSLAGIHRILLEAAFLRAFDFAVPVGALDEADRERSIEYACALEQVVDHGGRAPAIRLHGKAQALLAPCARVTHQGFDDLQRQLEAVLLLGIDG